MHQLKRVARMQLDIDVLEFGTAIVGYVGVESKSNFPTPVGGVITLADNTVYVVNGTIDLGTDHIVVGTGTIITGRFSTRDNLLYTGAGAAIRSTAPLLELACIGVIAPVGAAFEAEGSVVTMFQTTVIAPKFATFTDCSQIVLRSVTGFELDDGIELITSTPQTLFAMLEVDFRQATGATGAILDFGTSVWDTIRLSEAALITKAGGTAVLGAVDNGNLVADVGRGTIVDCRVNGPGAGLVGITPNDILWSVLHTDGLLDSTTIGEVSMSGNATPTVIGVQGTMTKVLGTTSLNIARRFDAGDPVVSNRLRYLAVEDRTLEITVQLAVSKASGGSEEGSIRIFKNGLAHGVPFAFQVDNKGRTTVITAKDDVTAGDYYEVYLTNNDSTSSILVSELLFTVKPIG